MASRRQVLKTIGLVGMGAAAAAARVALPGGHAGARTARAEGITTPPDRWNGEPLARVTQAYQFARAEPHTDSDVVTELLRDRVVRVWRLVRGQHVFPNSDLWLETKYGYLYASFVQPMRYHLPVQPQADLGEGRWAQLIVPYSEAFKTPDPFDAEASKGRVYYGSTFRVTELVTGADGRAWYRVKEQYQTIYLRATHLRLIPGEELAPLSPEVEVRDKHLVINLTEQTVTAYEYDQPVWTHLVSSGVEGWATPVGTYYVWEKRISERMVASTASDDPDFYNLPGVPYVCYFTDNWIALHGTYWHNDYGRPRSHGCVNVPSDAARWLWRWTTPHYPLDDFFARVRNRLHGTRIVVRA